jgi:tRNA A22 N-methylase
MNDLDYKVLRERIIKENNKYYNLIVFIKGNYKYSEEELLLGMNHDDVNTYKEYLEFLFKKYSNIKMTAKNKNKKIDTMLKCINSKLEYLR